MTRGMQVPVYNKHPIPLWNSSLSFWYWRLRSLLISNWLPYRSSVWPLLLVNNVHTLWDYLHIEDICYHQVMQWQKLCNHYHHLLPFVQSFIWCTLFCTCAMLFIGHGKVQNCRLFIFPSPCSTLDWANHIFIERVLYKYHWEFLIRKKIIPMLIIPYSHMCYYVVVQKASCPMKIIYPGGGGDDDHTPLLSLPSIIPGIPSTGSGDVTPVRITPLASQTATPHNTPLGKCAGLN